VAPEDGRVTLRHAPRTELVLLVLNAVVGFVVGWLVGGWFTALVLGGAAVSVCGGVIGYRRLKAE